MNKPCTACTIAGGVAGTVAMTMLMYGAPMMGMPKMDVAAMIGSILGA